MLPQKTKHSVDFYWNINKNSCYLRLIMFWTFVTCGSKYPWDFKMDVINCFSYLWKLHWILQYLHSYCRFIYFSNTKNRHTSSHIASIRRVLSRDWNKKNQQLQIMKDIPDTVNDVCTDCCYVMGYNYICAVGYCLYGTLLSRTNRSSSSHRCLCRHQWKVKCIW